MYINKYQSQDQKKAICNKCNSTRILYTKGKLICNDCNNIIGSQANKYNAIRTIAKDGMRRDSKFEANVADELFIRKQAADIKDYDSQYKVEMWAYDENGKKAMKVSHKVDFRIHHNDGSFELYEAKGIQTSDYKMRRKWLETFWLPIHKDHTYTVVKQNSRRS